MSNFLTITGLGLISLFVVYKSFKEQVKIIELELKKEKECQEIFNQISSLEYLDLIEEEKELMEMEELKEDSDYETMDTYSDDFVDVFEEEED